MPDIQKAAYLEALEKVPDIVEKETNTKMFLRCEHYNSQTAAERLAQHWKQRKLLFGPERAFLPMTLEGAMKDDMFQLEQGFVVRNPNDAHGRPVVFLDRSNSTKSEHYDRDGWLRCMWYIVQTFANEEEYQKTGYVCIINLKDYDANKSGDRIGAKKMFLYVRECWVPRFKAYHATYLSRQTPVKLVEPAIRQMQGPHIRLHLRNHYGYDSDNIEAMAKYGLKAEHLSKSIGGKQTLEDHLRWIEEQKAFEQKEPGE